MLYHWSPARNAEQLLREFSHGAARWEGGDGDEVRFLIFGKLEEDETDYTFRQEVRLVRKGLEALGFEVCGYDTYWNMGPTTCWAFVVRPKVRPRHEQEEDILEMQLVHLAWRAWRFVRGIKKEAAPQQPLPEELVRHDEEGQADAPPARPGPRPRAAGRGDAAQAGARSLVAQVAEAPGRDGRPWAGRRELSSRSRDSRPPTLPS